MADRFRRTLVSGLVGTFVGGTLVFALLWFGPIASRDRAISELERTLQDQDTQRDDACAVDEEVEAVRPQLGKPMRSIRT